MFISLDSLSVFQNAQNFKESRAFSGRLLRFLYHVETQSSTFKGPATNLQDMDYL